MNPTAETVPETEETTLLGGRLRVLQPLRGYRAGMDAALLAAALPQDLQGSAVEFGCGVGGALLQGAFRLPGTRFLGVERDAAALALANTNIGLNGLNDRVKVIAGEVGRRDMEEGLYDLAFANPPYFDDPTALRPPAPERMGAWIADDGLGVWLDALSLSVRSRGQLLLIHRADRLGDILTGLASRCGSFAVRQIQSKADEPAKRVIVRAVRDGRAPLALLPPLVMHEQGGASTPVARAILTGERSLDWTGSP